MTEAQDSTKGIFAGVGVARKWDGRAVRGCVWAEQGAKGEMRETEAGGRVADEGRPDGGVRHTCSDHGCCTDGATVRQGGHNVFDITGAATFQHFGQGHP